MKSHSGRERIAGASARCAPPSRQRPLRTRPAGRDRLPQARAVRPGRAARAEPERSQISRVRRSVAHPAFIQAYVGGSASPGRKARARSEEKRSEAERSLAVDANALPKASALCAPPPLRPHPSPPLVFAALQRLRTPLPHYQILPPASRWEQWAANAGVSGSSKPIFSRKSLSGAIFPPRCC